LPDETSAGARTLLVRLETESASAPAIWTLEIGDALLTAERRKRISKAECTQLLRNLAALPVALEAPISMGDLPARTDAARELGLSLYDASYLALVQTRRCALATPDRDLRKAAMRSGLETLP
jgi:predicted nucleic acid-binding protein